MAKFDLRNRAPSVERLPDDRLRVTRIADILNEVPKDPAQLASLWLTPGTADTTHTSCLLIKQEVHGQSDAFPDTSQRPPVLIRVYEEISPTGETAVGDPSVSKDQYGFKSVVIESVALSSSSPSYGTPGTTTAPSPHTDCYLKDEIRQNNGTTVSIKRTYINGGTMSDTIDLKFGGKLKQRTIKSLKIEPETPTGYTRISTGTDYIGGLPVYSYVYAAGSVAAGAGGPISESTEYRQSLDQGVGGVTITTIKYISDPTVVTNPITPPGGMVLISYEYSMQDGFNIHTGVWAKGTGDVASSIDTREGGKLKVYSKTSLNTPPTTPTPPLLGGTVTLIATSQRNADGYVIYEYRWAEGFGEAARATSYNQSADAGTTGVTVITITHLTAIGAGDPTSSPGAGYVKVASRPNQQDGYLVWTVVYAKGTGVVLTTDEIKNNGKLLIRTIHRLGQVPDTPTNYTQISSTVREEEGYKLYSYTYAHGDGEVSRETESRNNGALTILNIGYLTDEGEAEPTPGSITDFIEVSVSQRLQDGHILWSFVYAKGKDGGVVTRDTEYQNNNKLTIQRISFITSDTDDEPTAEEITGLTDYTKVGVNFREENGYRAWSLIYVKGKGGGVISRETEGHNNDKLWTQSIRYITEPGVSEPTAGDITGLTDYTKVSVTKAEQGGYLLWSFVYAKGTGAGVVSRVTDLKNNTKLTVQTIQYITEPAASEPSKADLGLSTDYTKITSTKAESGGYLAWTLVYALGVGEISRETEKRNGENLIIVSVRYLVKPADPEPTPTGLSAYLQYSKSQSDQDGYILWTFQYAKGAGEIARDIEYLMSINEGTGGVTKYTVRFLEAIAYPPSNPVVPGSLTPAITGVVLVSSNWSDSAGHRTWVNVYAKGTGDVITEVDQRLPGFLVMHRKVSINSAPVAPTGIISGSTRTEISSTVRVESGYEIYEKRWAEAKNVNPRITITTQANPDGSLDYVVTTISVTAEEPAYPGSGSAYLIELTQTLNEGHFTNRAVYRKPPGERTIKEVVTWFKPGTFYKYSPPGWGLGAGAEITRLADTTIDYDTTQLTDVPFSVDAWAAMTESYIVGVEDPENPGEYLDGAPTIRRSLLQGILSAALSDSGANAEYNGIYCNQFEYTVSASDPTTLPSNPLTIRVHNEPYLTAIDGTVVWKRTKTQISV